MRTAITIAKTHDGKWKFLASPEENLIEQRKNFRAFRAEKSHKEYSEVVYQESDGHRESIRLLTLEQLAAHEQQRAADHAEHLQHQEKHQDETMFSSKPLAEPSKPAAIPPKKK